jgi:hypothetical protein
MTLKPQDFQSHRSNVHTNPATTHTHGSPMMEYRNSKGDTPKGKVAMKPPMLRSSKIQSFGFHP